LRNLPFNQNRLAALRQVRFRPLVRRKRLRQRRRRKWISLLKA
jgi:hypothetical protein